MSKIYYFFLACFLTLSISGCDDCKDVTCDNGGTCNDGTCSCLAGFSGTNCEIEDLCTTQPIDCKNDGVCVDGTCDCKSAFQYYGATCSDHCVNGTYADGNCTCNEGIEGDACDVFSRDKFVGTYVYASDFVTNSQTSKISLGKYEEGDAWKVEMSNISSTGDTKATAEINGDHISIPKQNVTGQGGQRFSVESTEDGVLVNDGEYVTFSIVVSRLPLDITGATATSSTHKYSRPAPTP
jgi:hypothetical protein